MATVLEPAQQLQTNRQAQTEPRFVIRDVDWHVYDGIVRALGDHHTRITFDGRNIELMSPLPIHEYINRMIERLLTVLASELRFPIRHGGSTTFRRLDLERGLEPDSCYWIQNESAIRGKLELDFTFDPPPDLAIEVEISRSALDRMAIYAKLGVPEVWRIDGESLSIHLLDPDGAYKVSPTSRCLPELPVQEMLPYLRPDDELDDTTRVRQFVELVSPRFRR